MRDSLDLTKLVSQGKAYNKMYWNTFYRAIIFAIIVMLVFVLASILLETQFSTGYDNLLYRFDAESWLPVRTFDIPYDIESTTNSALWMTSRNDIIGHYDGDSWISYTTQEYCSGLCYGVWDMAIYGEDVWVLSDDTVLHFDGEKWRTVYTSGYGYFYFIAAGENGVIALDDEYYHIARHDGNSWTDQLLRDVPEFKDVDDSAWPVLGAGGDGSVWLYYDGLWRLGVDGWEYVSNKPESDSEYSEPIRIEVFDDAIWMLDWDNNFIRFDRVTEQWEQINVPDGMVDSYVYSIVQFKGTVYAATDRGLYGFDSSTWQPTPVQQVQNSNTDRYIDALAVDSTGTLWAIVYDKQVLTGATANQQASVRAVVNFFGAMLPVMVFLSLWSGAFDRINKDQWSAARQLLFSLVPNLPTTGSEDKAKTEDDESDGGKAKIPAISSLIIWAAILSCLSLVLLSQSDTKTTVVVIGMLILVVVLYFIWLFQKQKPKQKNKEKPTSVNITLNWKSLALGLIIAFIFLLPSIISEPEPWAFSWSVMLLIGLGVLALFVGMLLTANYRNGGIQRRIYKRALAAGNYEAALAMIDQLGEARANLIDMLTLRGVILLMMTRPEEAEDVFYQSMVIAQDQHAVTIAITLLDYGAALIDQKRYDEALPFREAAVRLLPGTSLGYHGILDYYLGQQIEPVRALEVSNAMMEFVTKPRINTLMARVGWVSAMGYHAQVLAWNGKHEEADQLMTQAFEAMPQKFRPWRGGLHIRAGMIAFYQHKMEEARSHFQQATELDPNGAAGQEARQKLEELTAA